MPEYTVIDLESTSDLPWTGELVAVGIGDSVYRPEEGRSLAKEVLADPTSVVVCHTNFDLRWLVLSGLPLAKGVQFHDTKVMAFMLDVTQELGLAPLAKKYLGVEVEKPIRQLKGRIMMECSLGLVPIEDVPWDEMVRYNTQDLEVTAQLYEALKSNLQHMGQWQFFLDEEMPFSKLLIDMETCGLPMDRPALEEFYAGVSSEREALEELLVHETGCPSFNLKSGDQVASYIYDEMPTYSVQIEIPQLPGLDPEVRESAIVDMMPESLVIEKIGNKYVYGTQTVHGLGLQAPRIKAKKGKVPKRPSIDAETLALMHGEEPWVAKYLRWKGLNTLCRNYLEEWLKLEHDGRLYGRFDQARAETGRVVSRDPNLQAIPVSMEWNVRVLFREPMLVGDYSGLDARVAAHFSEDPLMLEVYRSGADLYGVLASNAWGGPPDKSNENRDLMKILMLSAQYGAAAGSIGDKIRISGQPEKARLAPQLLRDMEETLPRLFEWREEVLREAKALGYITTIAGRRRYLPDLYAKDWYHKARAERQCVASMVQGSSADIVRRCMLHLAEEIPWEQARMMLQVHDEILWKLGPEWEDETLDKIQDLAENSHGFDLRVPMKFPVKVADAWADKDAEGARSYRIVMTRGV